MYCRQLHQLSGGNAFPQGRCACRFHSDYFDVGLQGFSRHGRAGYQATAANGREQYIRVRCVVQNFQTDRALTGDNLSVGEGMDVGFSVTLRYGNGLAVGIIPNVAVEPHLCTPAPQLVSL